MNEGKPENLIFSFNEEAKVIDLLLFLKGKIGSADVFFRSGSIHLDYFLTLSHRLVKELTVSKLRLQAEKITPADPLTLKTIEMIKCVGSGGFSKVFLGRLYGKMMAIKMVDKEFILRTSKEGIIRN